MTATRVTDQTTLDAIRVEFEKGRPVGDIGDEFGISRSTVHRYAKRHGWVKPDAEVHKARTAHASAAAAKAWSQMREAEANEAGAAASRLRERVLDEAEGTNHLMLRALSIAYGIFVDKADKLADQVTDRHLVTVEDELDREIAELITQMKGSE